MKKALISPNEIILSQDGIVLGQRVAEVSDVAFEVAEPLFWIDCDSETIACEVYYDVDAEVIKILPTPTAAGE